MDATVVFAHQNSVAEYPENAPFNPGPYPEYAFGQTDTNGNTVYDAVRALFLLAGLDKQNYDSASWNPLRGLINPGETVLLKPNLIKGSHSRDSNGWQYGNLFNTATDTIGGNGRISKITYKKDYN